MQAKPRTDMLSLTAVYHHEGVTIAETRCQDYDDFRTLPRAIEVEGKVLGLMSWNSDRFSACYKSTAILGRIL